MTGLCIATEDRLSEQVVVKLVGEYAAHCTITQRLRRNGAGYLKSRLASFNSIAETVGPVVVLADLDRSPCAPALIQAWRGALSLSPRLLFRVAVREVEAWLLADRESFAAFLGISPARIEREPETLDDPKEALLALAKRAKSRTVREDLLPERGSPSPVGLNYNNALGRYVREQWNPERARYNAPSLERAIGRIGQLL